ncbi:aminoglycoside phosphotransferase family protein [Hydrogenovibrio kuenenii]|uniref:aminoglycoside phosphotransferase family protein n=1 Tax=Hydrogenovibrio kuenenii TaxID=63658 RepID=UPI0004645000|nr:phosphotransferase [Hydrogenovibrio kuenenii]
MTQRFDNLQSWLEQLDSFTQDIFTTPEPASNDASFRRYFRTQLKHSIGEYSQGQTFIVMDAPPQHEDCRPFIKVSQEMTAMGVNVPRVIEQNLEQGFLLLTDLGADTYASKLNESTADYLYRDAMRALIKLQSLSEPYVNGLPSYDGPLLATEMSLFSDWLCEKHLGLHMSKLEKIEWQDTQDVLIQSALQQPRTYVHRDYHSRNLMVLAKGNPGVLDFQDAVHGPLTYDAVSLFRDCYVRWPAEQVKEWIREYFLRLVELRLLSRDEWKPFVKSIDLMGIQRHLKASGIFARLYHRDGKDGYLADIPNTLNYIVEVGREYPEMRFVANLVEEKLLPTLIEVNKAV